MVFLKYAGCNFPNDTQARLPLRIQGDADIAGPGVGLNLRTQSSSIVTRSQVMTAFIVTAWITIVSATIASLRNWQKIESPSFITFSLGAEDLLGPLCDLQAITGVAIVIAGFSQWHSITYYHQEFVTAYWYLTSNSFWSGRRAYMYEAVGSPITSAAPAGATPTSGTAANSDWTAWRVYTRRLFIAISVALGFAWSLSTMVIELQHWDETDPQKCYNYNDATFNRDGMYYSGVMLFGLLVYFVSLLLSFLKKGGTIANRYNSWFAALVDFPKNKRQHYAKAISKLPATSSGSNSGDRFTYHIAAICWGIVYCLARFTRGVVSVWSYGDSHSPEFFVFYYMFVAWNTWDLIMLKVMNASLVDDETKMGFGQVLALILLVQILLNVIDIWKGKLDSIEPIF
jgi:hypothetical protein